MKHPRIGDRVVSTNKKPKSSILYSWLGEVSLPDLSVPDHVGTPTGILDANGEEIVRQPRKIGFI